MMMKSLKFLAGLAFALAFFAPPASAADDCNAAKISCPRKLPDDKTFNEVMSMLEKAKSSPPESVEKEYGAIL